MVAIIIGQATLVRPLFTRRFWSSDPLNSSGYSSNKRSNGYESHELSSRSNAKASRLGFRPVKDPYNVSVLQTERNESEEKIIPSKEDSGFNHRVPSQKSDQSDQRPGDGIVIKREVDVSTSRGKQDYQNTWRAL